MMRTFSTAIAALALAAPALAQSHAGHASSPATMDHSKMNHGQMNHGSMAHGQMNHAAGQSSMLKSSTPADGAVLKGAPATLALTFAHPVLLQNVMLVNAAGKTTKVMVPATNTPTDSYQLTLPKLGKGAYTVNWNAGGQHAMSGRLSFQVQ